MQKSPKPRHAAALDHQQLDLPLFAGADSLPVATPSAPSAPIADSPSPSTLKPGKERKAPPAPLSPLAPDGSRMRTLELGARSLQYRLKRSSRKSIGFAIDASGLTITAPRWVTIADIENAIVEKQRWIFSKLIEWHIEG
jgi:hypothetical protein